MIIMVEEHDVEEIEEDEKAYKPKEKENSQVTEKALEEKESKPEIIDPEKKTKGKKKNSVKSSVSDSEKTAPGDSNIGDQSQESKPPEQEPEKKKVHYTMEKVSEIKEKVDEIHLIKTIVVGSDWEEVIQSIIEDENINPWDVDIIKLVDAFMNYLRNLTKFDFRVPARFILIAAVLLRMKCEVLVVKELKPKEEKPSELDVNVPLLDMPIVRVPKRKVTITDLIGALSKAIAFEERKTDRKMRVRKTVENLIVPVEDIEVRIKRVYDEIYSRKETKFSELVGKWDRPMIVEKFIPVLHLSNSGVITCEQNELFGEIFISLKEEDNVEEIAKEAKKEEENLGIVEENSSTEEQLEKETDKICQDIEVAEKKEVR